MKQIFYRYELWEDYQAGMYNEDKQGRKERIEKAIQLLSDEKLCYTYMKRVSNEWIHSAEQNFTNDSTNHQAFLGQTACCLYAGVHEDETREAWGHLTNIQRYKANKIADKVYEEWKREYQKEHSDQFQLSLF